MTLIQTTHSLLNESYSGFTHHTVNGPATQEVLFISYKS